MADETEKEQEKPKAEAPKAEAPKAPAAQGDEIAPSWTLSRIDALTRQKRELEDRLQAAESKLRSQEPPKAPPAAKPDLQKIIDERRQRGAQPLTQEQIDALVAQRVAEQRFAEEAGKVYDSGKTDFEDFEQVMATYKTIGGLQPTALQAAMEIGNAHKVLYTLARDPNEAYRVMQLPPAAQAAALAKISATLGREKGGKVSKAVEPVGAVVDGSGGADNRTEKEKMTDSNLSMEEWVKLRRAQRAKRQEDRRAMGRR